MIIPRKPFDLGPETLALFMYSICPVCPVLVETRMRSDEDRLSCRVPVTERAQVAPGSRRAVSVGDSDSIGRRRAGPGWRACDPARARGDAQARGERGRDCVGKRRRAARPGDGRERCRCDVLGQGLRGDGLRRRHHVADSEATHHKFDCGGSDGRGW